MVGVKAFYGKKKWIGWSILLIVITAAAAVTT
jgi:hypothetical protein